MRKTLMVFKEVKKTGDGRKVSNLRHVDEIVLLAGSVADLQELVEALIR